MDAYTADSVALAVVGAAEILFRPADGGVVVLGAGGIVPSSGGSVGDVLRLKEFEADAVIFAIVHVIGQVAQVVRALDVIGVGTWGLEDAERRGVGIGESDRT